MLLSTQPLHCRQWCSNTLEHALGWGIGICVTRVSEPLCFHPTPKDVDNSMTGGTDRPRPRWCLWTQPRLLMPGDCAIKKVVCPMSPSVHPQNPTRLYYANACTRRACVLDRQRSCSETSCQLPLVVWQVQSLATTAHQPQMMVYNGPSRGKTPANTCPLLLSQLGKRAAAYQGLPPTAWLSCNISMTWPF
jgi:hypothetical protein